MARKQHERLYEIEFGASDWETICDFGFEPFEIGQEEAMTEGQWRAIADMALGKAVRVERGDLGDSNMGDGVSVEDWADQLKDIAKTILDYFAGSPTPVPDEFVT